jgi:hypothetical protein
MWSQPNHSILQSTLTRPRSPTIPTAVYAASPPQPLRSVGNILVRHQGLLYKAGQRVLCLKNILVRLDCQNQVLMSMWFGPKIRPNRSMSHVSLKACLIHRKEKKWMNRKKMRIDITCPVKSYEKEIYENWYNYIFMIEEQSHTKFS